MFTSKTEKHVTIMVALWNVRGDFKAGNFFGYEKTRVFPIATQLLPVSCVFCVRLYPSMVLCPDKVCVPVSRSL